MAERVIMRAKMRVDSVVRTEHGENLTMRAVSAKTYPVSGADENNTFAKFTPTATFEALVLNPALFGCFDPGDEYYLDFTKAEQPSS